MFYLKNLCSLCLAHNKRLTSLNSINSSAEDMLERIIPEFMQHTSGIQKKLCDDCLGSLNAVFKFRRKCLVNITFFDEYLRKLQSEYAPYKYLAVTVVDVKLDIKKEVKNEIISDENICSLEDDLRVNCLEIDDSTKQENSHNKESNEEQEENDQQSDVSLEIKEEISEDILDDEDTKSDVLNASSISDIENTDETENQEPDCEGRLKCTECGEEFHNRMRDIDSSKCQKCQTIFEDTNTLRISKRNRSIKKSHVCNTGKKLRYCLNLKRHINTHSNEKPYECSISKKRSNSTQYLRLYESFLTGQKPFKCTICEKAFVSSVTLKNHIKCVHNNEKPYLCTTCQKCFYKASDLKRHELIHTGEKPFSCDVCPKKFNRRASLRIHKRIHDGIKPFECGLCGESFYTSGQRNQHERTQHKENSKTT